MERKSEIMKRYASHYVASINWEWKKNDYDVVRSTITAATKPNTNKIEIRYNKK